MLFYLNLPRQFSDQIGLRCNVTVSSLVLFSLIQFVSQNLPVPSARGRSVHFELLIYVPRGRWRSNTRAVILDV